MLIMACYLLQEFALVLMTDDKHMTLTSNQTWARAFATYTYVSQGPVIN